MTRLARWCAVGALLIVGCLFGSTRVGAQGDGPGDIYGLGGGLSSSGAVLPSVGGFASDEFTGSASVSVPIDVPAGPGGLSPALGLSYSSESVNTIRRLAGSNEHAIQASPVGYGWNLSGISYVSDSGRHPTLVLNGTSVRIDGNGGTTPHIFARVTKNVGHTDKRLQNPGEWIVEAKDGTTYYFGMPQDGNVFNNLWNWNAAKWQPVETLVNIDNMTNPDQGGTIRRKVVKYFLREVVDPSGNRMFFEYQGESRVVSGCDRFNGRSNTDQWVGKKFYHRATLPTAIRWGTQGDASTAKMRVDFGYEDRSDDNSWSDSGCNQAQYSNRRLANIKVTVDVNGTDHLLRRYDLTHGYETRGNDKHLRLDKVSQRGSANQNGQVGSELFNQTFVYSRNHTKVGGDINNNQHLENDGFNGLRLIEGKHSMGGKVTFKYQKFPVGYCRRGKTDAWSNCDYRFDKKRVQVKQHNVYANHKTSVADSSTIYEYFGGLERRDDRAGITSLGHAEVKTSVRDGAGKEQAYYHNTFYQRPDGAGLGRGGDEVTVRSPHPALGMSRANKVWQPKDLATASRRCDGRSEGGGRCLLSHTENRWETLTKSSGTWQVATTYDNAHPRWTRAQSSTTVVDGSARTEQKFAYDNTYGNRVYAVELINGNKKRATTTKYFAKTNQGDYIVDRPQRVRVFNFDDNNNAICEGQTWTDYDGNGLPTKTWTQIDGNSCPDTKPTNTSDAKWNLQAVGYDRYGNATKLTSYGENANLVTNVQFDSEYNLFPVTYTNANDTSFKETVKYYGVPDSNGQRSSVHGDGYWGAPEKSCPVNKVCDRQGYDEHGRTTKVWSGGESSPTTTYSYWNIGTWRNNTAYMVAQWTQPRQKGNFLRTHYNGLGQVVLTQTAHENWSIPDCRKCELAVRYGYDALGNKTKTSKPQLVDLAYNQILNQGWGTHSTIKSDALGRVLTQTAPNRVVTKFTHTGWTQKAVQGGKTLSSTTQDGFGNIAVTRTEGNGGGATISNTYNSSNQLTKSISDGTVLISRTYDIAGRLKSETDANRGTWTKRYDRQGRIIETSDARNKRSCMYFDNKTGRPRGNIYTSGGCPRTASDGALDTAFTYDNGPQQAKGQLIKVTGDNYARDLTYNSKGLISKETVKIDNQQFETQYGYESGSNRVESITYPNGDKVTEYVNGMGLPTKLTSTKHGTIVDSADYDETGRIEAYRMPAGGSLWRTHTYHPWTGQSGNGNGRLDTISIGTSRNASNRLSIDHSYDQWGNITSFVEKYGNDPSARFTFDYDGQNRVKQAFGDNYTWKPNGNMAVRKRPDGTTQRLSWNERNQLASVNTQNGAVIESYLYSPTGDRIKKTNSSGSTYYPSDYYEKRVEGGNEEVTTHYLFGGLHIAESSGGTLTYTHGDRLNSTTLQTNTNGAALGNQRYKAYGDKRGTGSIDSDHGFTGQRDDDATGLMYYKARYYDTEHRPHRSPDGRATVIG